MATELGNFVFIKWYNCYAGFSFLAGIKPWDIHEGIYGLVINLFSLITVSLITQKTEASIVEKFTHA